MIDLPKWACKVTLEMLPESHRKFAKDIGVEATLRLCFGFGGNSPYIPTIDAVQTVVRNSIIRKAFREGESVSNLARKYRISNRAVQRIVEDYRR